MKVSAPRIMPASEQGEEHLALLRLTANMSGLGEAHPVLYQGHREGFVDVPVSAADWPEKPYMLWLWLESGSAVYLPTHPLRKWWRDVLGDRRWVKEFFVREGPGGVRMAYVPLAAARRAVVNYMSLGADEEGCLPLRGLSNVEGRY